MPPERRSNIQIGLLLRQAHQLAARSLNDALLPLGLTGRHFGVMLLLHRHGVSTQRDLIKETWSDKAGMVRTVEDLENLGCITRTPSANDRRLSEITLTDKGVATFTTARSLAVGVAEELFEPFSPAELETLEALLTRFVAAQGPAGSDRSTGSAGQ